MVMLFRVSKTLNYTKIVEVCIGISRARIAAIEQRYEAFRFAEAPAKTHKSLKTLGVKMELVPARRRISTRLRSISQQIARIC
jgi:hypothetical protein